MTSASLKKECYKNVRAVLSDNNSDDDTFLVFNTTHIFDINTHNLKFYDSGITSLDFFIKASLISPRVAVSDTSKISYKVGFLEELKRDNSN